MKIIIEIISERNQTWYDWTVEGDPNARGDYCGTTNNWSEIWPSIDEAISRQARHPYNPKLRTEY